jgi:cathepsin D
MKKMMRSGQVIKQSFKQNDMMCTDEYALQVTSRLVLRGKNSWSILTVSHPSMFGIFVEVRTLPAGSSDLWVPSSSCTSSTCSSKSKYTASKSSTSTKESGSFSIEYGDGSTVSGPVYEETVTVAGVTATKQAFSPVTTLSSSFADDPIDGILGLAFKSISNLNANPFFVTANSQGTVKSNEFSFFLASSGSELYLGGTDSSKFSGTVEPHNVDTSTGFWQITGGSIATGGKTAVSNFETIIDSGTTIMYGPTSAVKTFYSKVSGAKLFDSTNGFYSFPCSSVPEVSFSWGGNSFAISSAK